MPDFEMPLEELYTYGGTNPKPNDLDAFWEKGLEELRGRAPDVIFKSASFSVPFCECFDLWFSGADGARIHAQYVRPYRTDEDRWIEDGGNGHGELSSSEEKNGFTSASSEEQAEEIGGGRSAPEERKSREEQEEAKEAHKEVEADFKGGEDKALLLFHGYSRDAGPWVEKLAYAAAGFHVFALDCRGQAGLSKDKGGHSGNTLNGHLIRGLYDGEENLYYRQVFLDTVRLADIAAALPEINEERISVMGGSQGGALSLACAALVPEIEKAVVRYPFLSDFKRVWDMDLDENAYGELRDFFRMYDPLHEREEEIFTTLGYIDVHHLAPKIRAKVLFGCGGMDMICPPSTQFAAYNALTSEKILRYYPDFTHEELRGFDDEAFEFLLK